MMQRLIAAIGILTLTLTILPAMPDSASGALNCCNGIMCPMHAEETLRANCATDGAALKSCPSQAAVHYTATIVFALLAPAVLYQNVMSESTISFLPNLYSDVEPRVDSPPPRFLPIA